MKVKIIRTNGTVEMDGVVSVSIEHPVPPPVETPELPKQRKPRKPKLNEPGLPLQPQ